MHYVLLFSLLIFVFFYLRCRVCPAPLGSLSKIVSSILLSEKIIRKRTGSRHNEGRSIEDRKFKSPGNAYLGDKESDKK